MTVSRDLDGRWFTTFACDANEPATPAPIGRNVGIDLGLSDFAVLSTGERITHPTHMQRRERRLKRYQRTMTRKHKGSANRTNAEQKVARAHAKICGTRHWQCPTCGTRHDRDVNAAKNILVAAGLAETHNACGADVRHEGQPSVQSAVNQENPKVTTGIPVL